MAIFPMSLLNNWGNDYARETDAGVLLDVMTPYNSVPFRRENGTILAQLEANPMTLNTNVQARMSILLAINNYSLDNIPERQVASDYDLIEVGYDSDNKKRNMNASFSYVRILDNTMVTQNI